MCGKNLSKEKWQRSQVAKLDRIANRGSTGIERLGASEVCYTTRGPCVCLQTSEAVQQVRLKSGQVIDGTPAKQEAYFQALFEFAQGHETAFVICFIHRDFTLFGRNSMRVCPALF
jgi:hypothetical protein